MKEGDACLLRRLCEIPRAAAVELIGSIPVALGLVNSSVCRRVDYHVRKLSCDCSVYLAPVRNVKIRMSGGKKAEAVSGGESRELVSDLSACAGDENFRHGNFLRDDAWQNPSAAVRVPVKKQCRLTAGRLLSQNSPPGDGFSGTGHEKYSSQGDVIETSCLI